LILKGLEPGDIVLDPAVGMKQHLAAEQLACDFMKAPADSLVMLDDDMWFGWRSLERLRHHVANREYDVISAMNNRRAWPPSPSVLRLVEGREEEDIYESVWWPEQEESAVIPVDAVGLAFTMIRRSVLEKLDKGPVGRDGTRFFYPNELRDDTGFSKRCRIEAGAKLGVDTRIRTGHVGEFIYTYDMFRAWRAAGAPPVSPHAFFQEVAHLFERRDGPNPGEFEGWRDWRRRLEESSAKAEAEKIAS
jgi:hypothetical protein